MPQESEREKDPGLLNFPDLLFLKFKVERFYHDLKIEKNLEFVKSYSHLMAVYKCVYCAESLLQSIVKAAYCDHNSRS